MSPVFMGSEPVKAEGGQFKERRCVRPSRTRLGFLQMLDAEQRAKAIVGDAKGPTNNIGEAFRDNQVLDYMGIRGDALTAPQQEKLLELIGVWGTWLKATLK